MTGPALKSQLNLTDSFHAEYLEYYRLLPLEVAGGRLRVCVAGSPNEDALQDLRDSFGMELELVPVGEEEIRDGIRAAFASNESVVELVRDLDASLGQIQEPGDTPLADARDLVNQPPVVRYVNLLIREAHEAGASDIHLEATREGLRTRLRLDGVLAEWPAPPGSLQAAVVSRLKLLAELDIAERRAPQDGRIRVRLDQRELDLRVSTVPTLHGESVVLRLLERGGRPVGLDELGMASDDLDGFRTLAKRSHGILLATGPTGSGKTTTLYAALGLRHPSEEKIITVEDPVEYYLPGITQVPVHAKAGVSFATALRSILRQDPDVLMVGEMRDTETAQIAIQAAMTGHLVFSTLHTNDALSALTRLVDLKVETYLVAATVQGVLAQRLVRRICPDCPETYRPDPAVLAMLGAGGLDGIGPEGRKRTRSLPDGLQRGVGCARCRQTGYSGRLGIFELLEMTDEIRHALVRGAEPGALRQLAQGHGMRTLREDGWRKVLAGLTTVEEVVRVVG